MVEDFTYRYLKNDEKEAVRKVLLDLTDWFGLPESLENYVQESKALAVIGCLKGDEVIGFLTLKPTSDVTIELYVMGIYQQYHHLYIGTTLTQMALMKAKEEGYQYIQVKTLDPTVQDESYLKTYAFYLAMGFQPVEVLPLWDE